MGRPKGGKNKLPMSTDSIAKRLKACGLENWKIRDHQKESAAFRRCHGRVIQGKVCSIQWPRNWKGFLNFLKEVGPYPTNMVKPSIGRKDHDKGYVKGNIEWQEYALNSLLRVGTSGEAAAYPNRKPGELQGPRKGFKLSEETKQKISAKKKGYKPTPEVVEKITSQLRGKPRPEEVRRKISIAQKGRKFTAEHCQKISEAGRGKKRSPEASKKTADALRGRPRSEETKRKMSAGQAASWARGRKPRKGKQL